MLWRPREGLDLLDRYDTAGRAAGARFMLEVTSGTEPVDAPRGVRWTDVDRLVSWGLMVQGRLDDLVAMLPSEDQWPPRTPYTTPHPLLGLVWRGELSRARELFDQVPEEVRRRIHTDLWHYLEAWLLLAEDNPAGSLAAARQAIVHSRRTRFGFEPVFQIVEAEALLYLGRVDDAIAVLESSIESSQSSGLRAYQEWGQTFLGHALLLKNEDERAATLLTSCVESMSHAQRLLLLPAAATFLAEAQRRLGRSDAARDAAERAHEASVEHGRVLRPEASTPAISRAACAAFSAAAEAGKWLRVVNGPTATVRNRKPDAAHGTSVLDPAVRRDTRYSRRRSPAGNPAAEDARAGELPHYPARWGVPRRRLDRSSSRTATAATRAITFAKWYTSSERPTGLTLQRLPTSQIAWSDSLVVDTVDRQFERARDQADDLAGPDRLRHLQKRSS